MTTPGLSAILKKLTAKLGNMLGHSGLMRGGEPMCGSGLDWRVPATSRIADPSIPQGCPLRADTNDSNFGDGLPTLVPVCQTVHPQEQAQSEASNRGLSRFVRQYFVWRPVDALHRLRDWLDRIFSWFLPPHLIFLQLPAKLPTADRAAEVVPLLLSRLLMPVRESTSG